MCVVLAARTAVAAAADDDDARRRRRRRRRARHNRIRHAFDTAYLNNQRHDARGAMSRRPAREGPRSSSRGAWLDRTNDTTFFLSSKIHRILASITCTRRARHRSTRRRHHTITHPHGICTYRAHVRETRVLKNHITHHKGLQYTYTTTYDAHVCGVENPGSFRRRGSGDYISRVYSIGFAAAGSSRTCGVAHPRRRPWRGSRASRTRGSRARDGDGVDDVDDDGWHRMASMSTRWRCGEACFSASSS